ncbi:nucleotidyltransferase family protein [Nocardioides donggukensis]|uniref:nucleotidyltransferase family protein n=1 Tax=Nocardioides donggukensis TaxID=2774019 RepID=UPI00191CF806|nr:nucleotidyltransferase family protein [Nocardioides donggukensis]
MQVHGLLLAAGAGRRMGRPKALVDDWLSRGVRALRVGGCDPVTVVLGAASDEAVARLGDDLAMVVVATDWAEGMGASLRAGLAALSPLDAVLVTLVDLPDVGADVIARLLAAPVGATTLRRAAYDGIPGHPVLLGRDHWAGVAESATGDRGARDYLAAREVEVVECGDLATGRDVDRPS